MFDSVRGSGDGADDGHDRGAVAIVVAVFMLVALILLAFVVDRGLTYVSRTQLQSAVDAAALAGAQELCATTGDGGAASATTQAVLFADHNGVSVNPSDPDQLTIVTNSRPPFVSVAGSETLNSIFGGFAGVEAVSVAARATAARPCVKGYAFFAGGLFTVNGAGRGLTVDGAPAYGGALNFNGNGKNKTFLDGLESPTATTARWNDGVQELTSPTVIPSLGTAAQYAASIGLVDYITAMGTPPAANWSKISTSGDCTINQAAFTANAAFQVLYCDGTATISGTPGAATKMIRAAAIVLAGDVGWNGTSCDAAVLLYATTGDVSASGSDRSMCGTVYVPVGQYSTNGNGLSLHQGRVIAATANLSGNGGSYVSLDSDSILGPGDVALIQ